MSNALHSEREGYHTIDWSDRRGPSVTAITDLWRKFPELVVGRYLVNTSYDSGFVTLSDLQLAEGWRMVGQLAHSPQIRSADQIPHDQFDEWLVFDQPTEVSEFETMVNWPDFSPIEFGWEEKRDQFWEQVARLHPLHVIAENWKVYLVSRDGGLIKRILESEEKTLPKGEVASQSGDAKRKDGPPSLS